MRDFFAFFREIFHYRTKLDEVDFLLTGDML
jgi:predicted AAA+ superfamily ATPase